MNKRLDWLDIGKGLGMLLVMFGHADTPAPLKTSIYTFHMPLFFFLSGYLFNIKKSQSIFIEKVQVVNPSVLVFFTCFLSVVFTSFPFWNSGL